MSNLSLSVRRVPFQAFLIIAGGIIAISMGAIFIRLAQQQAMPSLFIAAARLSLAALILTPFALRRGWDELRRIQRGDLLLAALSGVFLAAHFATWVLSLEYTSVLISVVLVNTHPLWVALLEVLLLRARLGSAVIAGLLIALVGGLAVALPSAQTTADTGDNLALGSALAIAGAITVAVYFIIGRKLRRGLSLLTYIWLVYGCGAITLLLVVLLTRTPIAGYPPVGYLWLLGMALIPQLIGHTTFNYVLRFLPATYVSIATQLEPAASAFIAFFLFAELPGGLQVLGSVIILAGVILASLEPLRQAQAP